VQGTLHIIKIYQGYETRNYFMPYYLIAGQCGRVCTEDQPFCEKRSYGKSIKGNQKTG
jgi:hypothetical protein